MPTGKKKAGPDLERLDRTVAEARRAHDERQQSYRGQALKLFPWICGRCAREFDHTNVHQRHLEQPGVAAGDTGRTGQATHTPFADLASLLKKDG